MDRLTYITNFHPQQTPLVRMNGVCPYFTMFPLPFPYRKLRKVGRNVKVLDPFCGRGTTNFAARLLGIESVGLDSNPVAAAVAQSKLVSASPSAVIGACRVALADGDPGIPPQGEFWSLCYDPKTLLDICTLRNYLLFAPQLTKAEITLRAIILGILHGPRMKGAPTYLSNQMPRTYSTKPGSAIAFWRKRKLRPTNVDVLDAISRRARYLLEEVPHRAAGFVRLADSRKRGSYKDLRDFDLIVTSPPYLGMRTYWPDQWLRNWFLGGSPSVEYARADQITTQDQEQFTSDLASVWKESARACRPGAKLVARFGALPSYSADPSALITESLRRADCGWTVKTITPAGAALDGRRQADQFGAGETDSIAEIDIHCRLETD
jgi:hypothetical protein